MTKVVNWNAAARQFATFAGKNMLEPRGVLQLGIGEVVHFYSNDGGLLCNSEFGEINIEKVRDQLRERGALELGFGTNRDMYCWSMVVSGIDHDEAQAIAWTAFLETCKEIGKCETKPSTLVVKKPSTLKPKKPGTITVNKPSTVTVKKSSSPLTNKKANSSEVQKAG